MKLANRGEQKGVGAHKAHFSMSRSLIGKLNEGLRFAASLQTVFVLPQMDESCEMLFSIVN